MKNAFDGLISRLNMAEERILALEETSKPTKRKMTEKITYLRTVGQHQRYKNPVMGIPEGEERKTKKY